MDHGERHDSRKMLVDEHLSMLWPRYVNLGMASGALQFVVLPAYALTLGYQLALVVLFP